MAVKHSSVGIGGSTAKRRLNCPGSRDLEAAIPDESSKYADEGSALHDIMEDWVDSGLAPDVGTYFGPVIPALTEEQFEALEWCYKIVDKLIGTQDIDLEVYNTFPDIEGAGGTCDVVIFGDDLSYTLVDYKFGKGVPVVAEGNEQLMFYAATLRNKYGPAHTYHCHILQPRLDSHTSASFTDAEIVAFITRMQTAVAGFREVYAEGSWCKFCKAHAVCPAKIERTKEEILWQELSRDKLPHAMSIVEEVEEWCKEVRSMAYKAACDGAPIQGWKVVDKKAQLKWKKDVDTEVVLRRLARLGLSIDERAPRKMITAPQARDLLKKRGKVMVEGLTEKVSSGTTLVRESDTRPAVRTGVADTQHSTLASVIAAKRKDNS